MGGVRNPPSRDNNILHPPLQYYVSRTRKSSIVVVERYAHLKNRRDKAPHTAGPSSRLPRRGNRGTPRAYDPRPSQGYRVR